MDTTDHYHNSVTVRLDSGSLGISRGIYVHIRNEETREFCKKEKKEYLS